MASTSMEGDKISSLMNKKPMKQHDRFQPPEEYLHNLEDITGLELLPYELPEDNIITARTNDQVDTFMPFPKVTDKAQDIIEAYPISSKLPESDNIYIIDNDQESLRMEFMGLKCSRKEQDNVVDKTKSDLISSTLPETNKLTIEARKEGWIEQKRKRENGRQDKYYYHLNSDEMCRSLVEVHDFITDGIPMHTLKKMKKKSQGESMVKKVRGASLLRKIKVGSYNIHTKEIILTPTPQVVGECPPHLVDNLANIDKEGKASRDTSSTRHNEAVVPYLTFQFL